MFVKIQRAAGMLAIAAMLASLMACDPSGGGECTANKDCIDKHGPGWKCSQKDGKTSCTKGSTCPATCQSASDCSSCSDGKTACNAGICDVPKQACPSSCTADVDCTNCADGNTSCVGGTCGKSAPSCPNSCTADTECTGCAGGNNFCVGGTCTTKAPACPASCQNDGECASCTDNKTSCVNNVCAVKASPQCPSSCSSNADCASCPTGQQSCNNGTCGAAPPQCPSSCSSNTDCANCPSGQQACNNGTCGAAPPQCPSSCSSNADCANCPSGRQACNNGTCGLAPQCPSSCSSSADCASCPTGQQSCNNGTCGAAPPQCPSQCSADTDCANCPNSRNFCVQNACSTKPTPNCPSSCSVDLDCAPCPGTNIGCVQGTCQPKGNTCPPRCSSDAQCAPCGANFTCQNNICAPKSSTPGVGQACGQMQQCPGTGLICLLVQSQGMCFQDCSTNNSVCANNTDGRTKCVAVATDSSTNQTISVCLAEVGKGKPCGYKGTLQALCKPNQTPPLYCGATSGLCNEAVVQKKAGDACNKTGDNSEPVKICDLQSKLVCDDATAKCVTASVAQEGELCDFTGSALGKKVVCDPSKKDLICIAFNSATGNNRCHYRCNPQGASQCAHRTGVSCAALLSGGDGLCMDITCTADTDCVYKDYACSPQQGGGNICFPKNPTGPAKFGDLCGLPISTKACTAGLFCLTVQGATNGFCSQDCTASGSTCPKAGTISSTCTDIGNNNKACLFPCGTPGVSCPTGLTCQNVGFQTCLAP